MVTQRERGSLPVIHTRVEKIDQIGIDGEFPQEQDPETCLFLVPHCTMPTPDADQPASSFTALSDSRDCIAHHGVCSQARRRPNEGPEVAFRRVGRGHRRAQAGRGEELVPPSLGIMFRSERWNLW